MDKTEYPVNPDITAEIMSPKEPEVQFYLEEMQKMNNQMIDMQRELNRALRESRRIQEELRHSDQLKKALEAAKKADQAKMDFMSRMSHDLRTPMNVIMGLVAATLDDVENPDAVRKNMANIRSASDYMLGLINDILDMAKMERGEIEFNPEPYSYEDFVLEMKTMFQAQCDAKNLQLLCKEPTCNPTVLVDKLRLKQIIFNVLSNAVKYTPPGGTISVYADILRTDPDNKQLTAQFRVADTGIGMSEAFQQHLFEPFAQEDSTVTPELRGSGLGLSITKQLVERMGGTIGVRSQKGVGTTITVELTFPLTACQPTPEPAKAAQAAEDFAILHGKNILLAEDHPLNAMIARNVLEKQKMRVFHAENGKIAVELFQSSPVGSLDAVLMDIRMPEMTGLEAAQAIRALDRWDAASVPIIALSANTYPADVQASLDAGMNAHLPKPVDAGALYQTLAQYIS